MLTVKELSKAVNTLKYPSDMRQQGFVIDSCCYPWLAYKGVRFRPTEHYQCMTDLEESLHTGNLISEVQQIREQAIVRENILRNET